MVSENDSSPRSQHNPWNKGRIIGQKRPLKPRDVWTIRVRLQLEGGNVTSHCSTLLSIANLGAVISSGCRPMTYVSVDGCETERR